MTKAPQILISFNRFLDPIFTFYCQNHPDLKRLGWDKWAPPSQEELEKRIEAYKQAWEESGEKALKVICQDLGLEFKRNIIDVFIVSGNPRQFSRPIVMKSGFTPRDFINNLLHELIHVLLSDNESMLPPTQELFPNFPEETMVTRNHILVHALLKLVYLEVFQEPKRVEDGIASSKKHRTSEYFRAWEIVESEGYKELISQFKLTYNN